MRLNRIRHKLAIGCLAALAGCVTTHVGPGRPGQDSYVITNYYRNRAMDLRDVGTFTVFFGLAAGIKLQIGPWGVGAFFLPAGGGHGQMATEAGLRIGEFGEIGVTDMFGGIGHDEVGTPGGRSYLRGKNTTRNYADRWKSPPEVLKKPYNYTRLGFAIGFGVGLRVEVNPGELLDFVLGFFTLDIYGDDIFHSGADPKGTPKSPEDERSEKVEVPVRRPP